MKSITYKTFKDTMHNYVISLLTAKNIKFQEHDSYLRFRKIRSVFKNKSGISISSSSLFESTVTYISNEPDEDIYLGDIFNHIKRSISYELVFESKLHSSPSMHPGNEYSLSEGLSENFTIDIGFESVRFTIGFGGYGMLPIRDLAMVDLDLQSYNMKEHNSRTEDKQQVRETNCCKKLLGCSLL